MPRVAGQIDVSKNEAILDAAVELFAERGLQVSMEEVARRAGVSKQTIYNHYGGKAELMRALASRRISEIRLQLEDPEAAGNPEEALAAYARMLLTGMTTARAASVTRMAVIGAAEAPEIARTMFDAGTLASRRVLARFIRMENAAGRLDAPDPQQAAEFFGGMVLGSRQIAALLGVPTDVGPEEIDRIAREAAARFMRAYRP